MYWITDCKVCGTGTQAILKTYRIDPKDYPDFNHLVGYGAITLHLRFCLRCGFIYHDHVLSLEELQELYKQEDRITHKKETLQKKILLERASGFLQKNFHLSQLSKIIDIGSGDFSLLDEVSKYLPVVQLDAVNVSFPSDQRGKMRVFRVMLEDMNESHSYDLIILSHILEHIADFDLFFKQLKKLTHTETSLYVEVPFQIGPTLLLKRGFHAQHINYFTPLTLRLLLEKYGYYLENLDFDTEGGYVYYGIPGVIRAKFSPVKNKEIVGKVWYSMLFTLGYLLSPYIFIRGVSKRFLKQRGKTSKSVPPKTKGLYLTKEDINWIVGFLFFYFLLSTALHLIIFSRESYLLAMLVSGGIFMGGRVIRYWLKL